MKWSIDVRKDGTEINIVRSDGKYTFHIGDAFEGIKFNQKKADELMKDAVTMCNLLNKRRK